VAVLELADGSKRLPRFARSGARGLSVVFMRHRVSAEECDGRIVHLPDAMGRAEGFAQFNLGMVPLGLQASSLAPLWVKVAAICTAASRSQLSGPARVQREIQSALGARFFASFRRPALPRALTDVSALIAGGYRGILLRVRPRLQMLLDEGEHDTAHVVLPGVEVVRTGQSHDFDGGDLVTGGVRASPLAGQTERRVRAARAPGLPRGAGFLRAEDPVHRADFERRGLARPDRIRRPHSAGRLWPRVEHKRRHLAPKE
jgi:hypothetical protein